MNTEKIKIIGFDADDTLWRNEDFYRNTEHSFEEILSAYVQGKNILEELFSVEMQNLDLYGYGAKSFTLSMIETALKLGNDKIPSNVISEIIFFGKNLINMPIEILEDVEVVLENLYKNYRLLLITKGDLLDQERKLSKSGLQKYFHHIEVMSSKTEDDYSKLFDKLSIEAENFLMIGNSLKSDIMPVVNLGASAIHVPYKTTWQHELVDEEIECDRCPSVKKMIDVLDFFR